MMNEKTRFLSSFKRRNLLKLACCGGGGGGRRGDGEVSLGAARRSSPAIPQMEIGGVRSCRGERAVLRLTEDRGVRKSSSSIAHTLSPPKTPILLPAFSLLSWFGSSLGGSSPLDVLESTLRYDNSSLSSLSLALSRGLASSLIRHSSSGETGVGGGVPVRSLFPFVTASESATRFQK